MSQPCYSRQYTRCLCREKVKKWRDRVYGGGEEAGSTPRPYTEEKTHRDPRRTQFHADSAQRAHPCLIQPLRVSFRRGDGMSTEWLFAEVGEGDKGALDDDAARDRTRDE